MTVEAAMRETSLEAAIGRKESRTETILPERVAALVETLELPDMPVAGQPLPAGFHWLFFNPFVRRSSLGVDGHPKTGGFLPDTGLPRRMWAGGRISYHAPLAVGAVAEKESEILNVVEKNGRAGRLVFVTVRHRISSGGTLCIEEEQDIVYRAPPAADAPKPVPAAAPEGAIWTKEVKPDPVLLFRYSALTYNGHRIHYDRPYATQEEGYPGLVVHGPLVATLLQDFAHRCRPDERLTRFEFRGMAPLFVDDDFALEAAEGETPDRLALWAKGPQGELVMKAEAVFGA
ncbi:MaoC family dehydratase N-terminal domain-containing protein [uncultured Martelella sp.]|uniref:FAS1-like dehydratase domain-containing protein n=1 Tax=uncultured Martelella sp. TaxID=392331 RepID=UPI0029C70F64|nr:MaoC family dehydratase N-terminal domain-containing protein [uncultured Martelella sp.]